MSTSDVRIETREVSDFDRVALAGFGDLVITQGEEESLTIEASPEILRRIETEVKDGQLTIRFIRNWLDWIGDVLAAGFAGMRVRYHLTVKELAALAITGAGRVQVANLEADHLALELRGAGQLSIESLEAERLKIDLSGAGQIKVGGRVTEQTVKMTGAGSYDAPDLESQRVKATLTGLGGATVWVVEDLEAAIHSVGSVSYYGAPKVSKRITGIGTLNSLGDR
ncbi:MAG TPA: head GIN domain-containing protein [Anaerolineae bacterium]|nr:head GIN domain-containing protein [Anaerolineae bacterium]